MAGEGRSARMHSRPFVSVEVRLPCRSAWLGEDSAFFLHWGAPSWVGEAPGRLPAAWAKAVRGHGGDKPSCCLLCTTSPAA